MHLPALWGEVYLRACCWRCGVLVRRFAELFAGARRESGGVLVSRVSCEGAGGGRAGAGERRSVRFVRHARWRRGGFPVRRKNPSATSSMWKSVIAGSPRIAGEPRLRGGRGPGGDWGGMQGFRLTGGARQDTHSVGRYQ